MKLSEKERNYAERNFGVVSFGKDKETSCKNDISQFSAAVEKMISDLQDDEELSRMIKIVMDSEGTPEYEARGELFVVIVGKLFAAEKLEVLRSIFWDYCSMNSIDWDEIPPDEKSAEQKEEERRFEVFEGLLKEKNLKDIACLIAGDDATQEKYEWLWRGHPELYK